MKLNPRLATAPVDAHADGMNHLTTCLPWDGGHSQGAPIGGTPGISPRRPPCLCINAGADDAVLTGTSSGGVAGSRASLRAEVNSLRVELFVQSRLKVSI